METLEDQNFTVSTPKEQVEDVKVIEKKLNETSIPNNNNHSNVQGEDGIPIPSCGIKECVTRASVFCLKCLKYFCSVHDKVHLQVKAMRSHEREDAKKISHFLYSMECPDHSKDGQNDYRSKYIYVSQDTYNLRWGHKLSDVAQHGDKPYLQVSFIGPSGCGKSTMIRLLAEDEILPTPAMQGATMPTSSDINAFHSSLDDEKKAFIYVDCEGTGGAMSNLMLMNSLDNKKPIDEENSEESLLNVGEEQSEMREEERKLFFDAREPFVSHSYPRLLYLFSDVLVFMFTGETKERGTVLEALIHYGSSASAATVNQSLRPHLIIVFNHSKTSDITYYDVECATESYLDNQSANTFKLKCLYQSITIVHIPTAAGPTIMQAKEQVDKLGQVIREKVKINKSIKLGKPEYTRSKVLGYITKAMEAFNHDQNTKIDFFNLVTMEEQNNSNAAYIFKFANMIADAKLADAAIFDHLSYIVARLLLEVGILVAYKKHCIRNGGIDPKIGHPDAKFTNQFVEILKQVNQWLLDYMPCCSVYYCEQLKKNVYCQVRKKNHLGVHETTEIVKLELTKQQESVLKNMGIRNGQPVKLSWEGLFEQDPNYESLVESSQRALCSPETVFKTKDWECRHILKDVHFKLVCNVCLLEFPSEVRPECGHYVCRLCCLESPNECPICHEKSIWSDKSVPENAALRILCLESGNFLKSTTQCTMIDEIEKHLYSIPIAQLFDVISGVGSGALIGMSFITGNKKASRVLSFIEEFSDYTTKITNQLSMFKGYSHLSDDLAVKLVAKMSNDLTAYLPATPIFSTPMDCKFLCSSVTHNTISPNTPQTGNYNTPNEDLSNSYICDIGTLYFVDSENTNKVKDTSHHPLGFTINECQRYWGNSKFEDNTNKEEEQEKKEETKDKEKDEKKDRKDTKKIDIVASLGNGSISLATNMGPHEEWNSHKTRYSDSIKTMIRIDPVIPTHSLLGQSKKEMVSSISKETTSYLENNEKTKSEFQNLVDTLLAQMFYVEIQSRVANSNKVCGIIRSRVRGQLPKELSDQIKESPLEAFSVESSEGLPDDYKFSIDQDNIKYEPTLQIPFSIDNVETYNSFTISIKCNLKCNGHQQPSNQLISNCPIKF